VIDPHGDLALGILDAIPPSRIKDVCYLDVTDTERPVGFNPATRIAPERRALASAGIVSALQAPVVGIMGATAGALRVLGWSWIRDSVLRWMGVACFSWILATAEVARIAVTANAAIKVLMANFLYENMLSQAQEATTFGLRQFYLTERTLCLLAQAGRWPHLSAACGGFVTT